MLEMLFITESTSADSPHYNYIYLLFHSLTHSVTHFWWTCLVHTVCSNGKYEAQGEKGHSSGVLHLLLDRFKTDLQHLNFSCKTRKALGERRPPSSSSFTGARAARILQKSWSQMVIQNITINLIICSLAHYQHFLKISLKSVHNFWSYLANK